LAERSVHGKGSGGMKAAGLASLERTGFSGLARGSRFSIWGRLAKGTRVFGALAAILITVLVLVAPTFVDATLPFNVGDRVAVDFRSPVTGEFRDYARYEEAVARAQDNAPRPYLFEKKGREKANLLAVFLRDEALKAKQDETLNVQQRRDQLRAAAEALRIDALSDRALDFAMSIAGTDLYPPVLDQVLHRALDERGVVVSKHRLMAWSEKGLAHLLVSADAPISATHSLSEEDANRMINFADRAEAARAMLQAEDIPDLPLLPASDLLSSFLVTNVTPIVAREEDLRKEAGDKVEFPTIEMRRGFPIFPRSWADPQQPTVVRIDDARAKLIGDINTSIRATNFVRLIFFAGLVFGMMTFMGFYALTFQPELTQSTRAIVAIGFPVLVSLGVGRLLLWQFGENSPAGFAFPAALVGMLGVILAEPRFALFLVVCASTLFGIATGIASEQNFHYLVVSMASGFTAVASLFVIRQRSDVLMAGLKAGVVAAVSIIGVNTLGGDLKPSIALVGLASGLASAVLTFPCLLLLEKLAGISTDVALMELTTVRHPLLEQLEDRAPGTYQHTLNVTKLAEAAAVAIGGNYLLVRAGALFHDIGKMDKPKYFSENQVSPEDKRAHDKLSPHMSALIIKEHVRSGIQKAQEHNLPPRVIDFIAEHHGTTTIAYFYNKALKQYEQTESMDPVREDDFKYLGPSPRSRETAITLIADSLDAVATANLSAGVATKEVIRKLVRDVINHKFREEQFDHCDLTLRDLAKIQESFERTLEARFHQRVKYPGPAPKKRADTSASDIRKGASAASISVVSAGPSTLSNSQIGSVASLPPAPAANVGGTSPGNTAVPPLPPRLPAAQASSPSSDSAPASFKLRGDHSVEVPALLNPLPTDQSDVEASARTGQKT